MVIWQGWWHVLWVVAFFVAVIHARLHLSWLKNRQLIFKTYLPGMLPCRYLHFSLSSVCLYYLIVAISEKEESAWVKKCRTYHAGGQSVHHTAINRYLVHCVQQYVHPNSLRVTLTFALFPHVRRRHPIPAFMFAAWARNLSVLATNPCTCSSLKNKPMWTITARATPWRHLEVTCRPGLYHELSSAAACPSLT